MYTRTFHTHASSYRIDTIVIRFNGNFSTLSRNTGNRLDGDQTIVDFRNFKFEQTLQEQFVCTGKDDLRIVVVVIHPLYDSTHGFTFTVKISRDLFCFREQQLITLVIQQQDLLLPYLVNIGCDDIADFILILSKQTVFLQFKYL